MSEHESFVKSLEEVIGAAMDPGVAFANPSLQDIQSTVKAAIHGYIAMHVSSKMSLAKIDSIVNPLIPSNAASKDFNSELFVTTITEFIRSTIESDSLTGIDYSNSELSNMSTSNYIWNQRARPTNSFNGHPAVRPTTYLEVNALIGTIGVSNDGCLWDWQVLGVIESSRGKVLVYPGDIIAEIAPGLYHPISSFTENINSKHPKIQSQLWQVNPNLENEK